MKKENPFYYYYLFSKKKWWHYPILWFIPMKVLITEDGVVYYKQWGGKYFLYKIELLSELQMSKFVEKELKNKKRIKKYKMIQNIDTIQ